MIPELRPLEGKYDLIRPLRSGGMGAIYLVRHRLLEQLRVVKLMRPQLQDRAEFRDRFAREARVAIQLRHPNIAQLFDFAVDEAGAAFMVLEYVDGRDLKELIAARDPAPLGLKVEIAAQALDAIGFLHRKGFVHRDISPDNLMLSRTPFGEPLVKLIDLGIVKALESETGGTSAPGFLGKVRYAAPEQFESSRVDARSDLYSFGVLLYELLTGVHPFPGENMHRMVSGHMFQPPRPFEETDPESAVPAVLRHLVVEALSKNPGDRPPNADEFARRLRAVEIPDDRGRWAAALAELSSGDDAAPAPGAARPEAQGTPQPPTLAEVAAAEPAAPEDRSRLAEALVDAGRPEEAALLLRLGKRATRPATEDEATTVRRTRLERRVGDELVSKKLRDWREYLDQPDEPEPTEPPVPIEPNDSHDARRALAPVAPGSAPPVARTRTPIDARLALGLGLTLVVVVGLLGWRWDARRLSARPIDALAVPASAVPAARALPQPPVPVEPPAASPPGTLIVDAHPWGRIETVRSLASGEAVAVPADGWTPQRFTLVPGAYAVTVRHPELGAREIEVEVVAGQVVRRSVRFGGALAESFLAGGHG